VFVILIPPLGIVKSQCPSGASGRVSALLLRGLKESFFSWVVEGMVFWFLVGVLWVIGVVGFGFCFGSRERGRSLVRGLCVRERAGASTLLHVLLLDEF